MVLLESADLTLPEVERPRSRPQSVRMRLTILFHSQCERIGDVYEQRLAEACCELELSRLVPQFANPHHSTTPQPLQDPYLSRLPLCIRCDGDEGVIWSAQQVNHRVTVGGKALRDTCVTSEEEMERGVCVSLAGRVVLWAQYVAGTATGDVIEDHGLIGASDVMCALRRSIEQVATSRAPVLLRGETGAGKELVAQAIHRRSQRRDANMVCVNMAALPRELAVSELFGVRRGAFTGADRDANGYFQQADAGTLFLDEIGDTSREVQAQLLRVLEAGEVQVVGGRVQSVDVRIISATDAQLESMPGEGFSQALQHRLSALKINVPPLRARLEDIGRLAVHSLRLEAIERDCELLLMQSFAAPEQACQWAMLFELMVNYHWPGNVRELINVCRQLIAGLSLHDTDWITAELLAQLNSCADAEASNTRNPPYRSAARLAEHEVREAMVISDWEVSRAASILQVSRPALYKRIESIVGLRLAVDVPDAELRQVYQLVAGDLRAGALQLQVSAAALRRRWRALDLE